MFLAIYVIIITDKIFLILFFTTLYFLFFLVVFLIPVQFFSIASFFLG